MKDIMYGFWNYKPEFRQIPTTENTDGCEKIFFSFFLNKTDKNEELKKKDQLKKVIFLIKYFSIIFFH